MFPIDDAFDTMNDETAQSPRARSRRRVKKDKHHLDTGAFGHSVWAFDPEKNSRAVAKAAQRLHDTLSNGLRHFSAIRRVVPLHLAAQEHGHIIASENAVDPTEVFALRDARKWQRRTR